MTDRENLCIANTAAGRQKEIPGGVDTGRCQMDGRIGSPQADEENVIVNFGRYANRTSGTIHDPPDSVAPIPRHPNYNWRIHCDAPRELL